MQIPSFSKNFIFLTGKVSTFIFMLLYVHRQYIASDNCHTQDRMYMLINCLKFVSLGGMKEKS